MSMFDLERNKAIAEKAYLDSPTNPSGLMGGTQEVPGAIRRMPATHQAAEQMGQNCSRLDALLSELERKLMAVLKPSTPPPASNQTQAPREIGSTLAQGLFEQADTLRMFGDRLDSIINRIDL